MNGWCKGLGAALCLALGALGARAADPAPDLGARFPQIRRQLASDDFATREAGQKELDQIPPAQAEALRALAAAESDPEVKVRVEARLDAMDLYLLVHPQPLSVNFQKAALLDVVAELNRQIGGTMIAANGNGGAFTLQADNRPFWEIVNELNRQSPLTVTTSMTITPAGTINYLRLTPGGAAHEYKVVDTFALLPVVTGQPGAGSWMVRVSGYADPRVRISGYSQLRIEKITDQDGNSLMPLVMTNNNAALISSIRPMTAWTSYATLNAAPGVTRIKELRAGIALSILDKERTLAIDLTKEVEPIDSPRGQISVDKNGAGAMTLRIAPSPNAPNPPVPVATVVRSNPMNIRVFDKDGKALQTSYISGTQINMTLAGTAARVELSWPDKTREMVLPVEFTDLDVPAGPAVIRPIILPQ